MSSMFWILILSIFAFILFVGIIGVIIYFKTINRFKNGLVARIHMPDTTVKHYRYDKMPTNNIFTIKETDNTGQDVSKTYFIDIECIEKGLWGKYIDYDYNIPIPINPKNRSKNALLVELKELFKHIGALLDTDLHVKLLRNSKFESFVRIMLMIILVLCVLTTIFSGISMFKSFSTSNDKTLCTLTLDNSTWDTIYTATHVDRKAITTQTNNPTGQPVKR